MIPSGLLGYEEKAPPVLSDWSSEVNGIRKITKGLSSSTFVLAVCAFAVSEIVIGNSMGRIGDDPLRGPPTTPTLDLS
jgi:hypothetical protein